MTEEEKVEDQKGTQQTMVCHIGVSQLLVNSLKLR